MATGTVAAGLPTAPAVPASLEEKIQLATQEAAQVASIFSPVIGTAIQAGAEVEPVISGLIHLFAALFRHHVSQAVAPAPAPKA